MAVLEAQTRIVNTVTAWEGITHHPHRFGGVEFLIGKREIGHIHGDYLVDIPFPKKIRDELVAAHQAQPHHVLPESGWISYYLQTQQDVAHAIDLLRRSYEIAHAQVARRQQREELTE